ncbi:MAG: pyridoxal phosphate-dependent aminotransferase [Eubacteriales bacterium]|nr:pyridoxal phosphate-dependent aminotransferase [Eubacteriales bacterium]
MNSSFDFDEIIDRRGTGALKYDISSHPELPEDVLPLWIADMDFQTAPCVIEALHRAADHGIFGYTKPEKAYDEVVTGWFRRHHGWCPDPSWMVQTEGVVMALALAVRAYSSEGDSVLIQQPVYYPFSEVIRDNGRKIVSSDLKLVNGHYEIDFDDFEKKIEENLIHLFILCSPHNPGGRVWTEEELKRIGDICLQHHVTVVSDEIHCDLLMPGYTHHPFMTVDPAFEDISVICTAPSKTFNIAGLQISNIFIKNRELRRRFRQELFKAGCGLSNIMGLTACQAAYEEGDGWYEACLKYIQSNLAFARDFLKTEIPEVQLIEPEGTYLLWLDFRGLGLSDGELEDLIVKKARLWLDDGKIFGKAGAGFERVNIACPRKVLEKGLIRLRDAVREYER